MICVQKIALAVTVLACMALLAGCGGTPSYLTQFKASVASGQTDALADQQAALAIATASKDRAAIQCATQGVAIEQTKAVGPLSAAMKADEYLQMAAIDCKPLNAQAVGNALTLSGLLAAIGL